MKGKKEDLMLSFKSYRIPPPPFQRQTPAAKPKAIEWLHMLLHRPFCPSTRANITLFSRSISLILQVSLETQVCQCNIFYYLITSPDIF